MKNSRINKRQAGLIVVILIVIFLVELLISLLIKSTDSQATSMLPTAQQPTSTPTPTPIEKFTTYNKPTLAKSDRYDVYLIGDSMTHAFGPRGGIFTELLSKEYPGIFFEVSNYAAGGQSLVLLPERLKQEVQADKDLLLKPILEADPTPDLIIIESFGYNPPSELGTKDGLVRHNELLTEVMTTLTNKYPNAVIMFFTAIGPDKRTYGQSTNSASDNERWAQAEERIEYITNHIKYANEHSIPVINAYEESLDTTGDGDTKYINPDDDIHPSAEGLAMMARVMVRRITEESIFTKN